MNTDTLKDILLWCTLINFGVLLVWFGAITAGRGLVYGLHGRLFRLTPEQLGPIHYSAMAGYKLAVFLFNLVPYIALTIVG